MHETGCAGSCQLSVVLRSNKADGIPAKCMVCERKYKVPAGAGTAVQLQTKKGSQSRLGADGKLQEQLRALREEVKSLKAAQASPGGEANEVVIAVDDQPDEAGRERVKSLREKLRLLQNMDPSLRSYLDGQGGHSKAVADLEQELRGACTAQRESKPLATQKVSAEAHLRRVAKQHELAVTRLSELQKQQELLAKKISEQEAETTAAGVLVTAAKQEVASVAERIAADLRGAPTETVAPAKAAAPMAEVNANEMELILGTWALLPPEALLAACEGNQSKADNLLAMAKNVEQRFKQTAAIGSVAGVELDDMELDDAQAEQIIEAVFEDKEGESKEERADRVAATRAKLKAVKANATKKTVLKK